MNQPEPNQNPTNELDKILADLENQAAQLPLFRPQQPTDSTPTASSPPSELENPSSTSHN